MYLAINMINLRATIAYTVERSHTYSRINSSQHSHPSNQVNPLSCSFHHTLSSFEHTLATTTSWYLMQQLKLCRSVQRFPADLAIPLLKVRSKTNERMQSHVYANLCRTQPRITSHAARPSLDSLSRLGTEMLNAKVFNLHGISVRCCSNDLENRPAAFRVSSLQQTQMHARE